MSQTILNNTVLAIDSCEGRKADIFLSFEDIIIYTTLNLLYSGFDATITSHKWQQGALAGNMWTDIQTGGVVLNNDNLLAIPPEENSYLIRVVYTDECGFNHYTKVVIFFTAL